LTVDFVLFLLVNVALFVRPGELIPAAQAFPIYEIVIVANLLVAAPAVLEQVTERNLSRNPITACVLGVEAFIILSQLARLDPVSAWDSGIHFAKVVAYFLLLLGTVTTARRLFMLLAVLVSSTLAVSMLAVLDYHGKIDLPTLSAIEVIGEGSRYARLRGTGIFQDPNDVSMIIVASIVICVGGLFYKGLSPLRLILVAPIGFLGYALSLTQSRGGLLSLLAGCGAFFCARFGIVRAAVLGAATLPILLAGFGGRQVDFSEGLSSGTGRGRIELWSDGLEAFKSSPLFGVGVNQYANYAGGKVAHNSFVSAFVELGFVGGSLFLGVFAISGWSLWKLCKRRHEIAEPAVRHFLPYTVALLAAYCVAMMSLSRSFEVPTFMIAGCAAAHVRLAQAGTSLRKGDRFDSNLIMKTGAAGFAFLLFIYLYIKFFYRMG
jgi:O-antigen ligase